MENDRNNGTLLMFMGDPQELKEMTYIPTVSECLKKKRMAQK